MQFGAPMCLKCKHFKAEALKLGCEIYGDIPDDILHSRLICPKYEVR